MKAIRRNERAPGQPARRSPEIRNELDASRARHDARECETLGDVGLLQPAVRLHKAALQERQSRAESAWMDAPSFNVSHPNTRRLEAGWAALESYSRPSRR